MTENTICCKCVLFLIIFFSGNVFCSNLAPTSAANSFQTICLNKFWILHFHYRVYELENNRNFFIIYLPNFPLPLFWLTKNFQLLFFKSFQFIWIKAPKLLVGDKTFNQTKHEVDVIFTNKTWIECENIPGYADQIKFRII